MDWSPQQDSALLAVRDWLANPGDRKVFRLFGFAGTGKTTLAMHFASDVQGLVLFGAFTGKAASVMRRKGCPNATTIHRLIYNPSEKSRAKLLQLKEELAALLQIESLPTQKDADELKKAIKKEEERLRQPSFSLKVESDVRSAKLLVIDECSMVDQRMGEDLLSFNVPILVLGDPAQLPPVRGCGYFTDRQPDVMLTEIHRQARGSPVIALATKVRQGEGLPYGTYGSSVVKPKSALVDGEVMGHEQLLVGKNETRRTCNLRARELLGFKDPLPVFNDKVVCLRNNHEVGLLNGELWRVAESSVIDDNEVLLSLSQGEEDGVSVPAHRHYFEGRELGFWERREAEEFDYGYALTVHKSQGSQWDSVVVFDEAFCFRSEARRWLYTAITRAADRVTIVRN